MAERNAHAGIVADIVRSYGADPDMLIPMMQDVQGECGYLPREELGELSQRLGVPLARVYGIATFYASFRLMPKGDHTIQLCMGTVCFLKGAAQISEAIQREFELVPGGTSPSGKFTYSPVNCVGACALAPVMVVDGEYHGGLTVDSAVELLHKVAEGGKAEAAEGPAREEGEPGAPRAAEERAGRAPGEVKKTKKKAAGAAGKGARGKATKKIRRKTSATKKMTKNVKKKAKKDRRGKKK